MYTSTLNPAALIGIVVVVLVLALIIFLATHRKTAMPNEVIIISGAFISGKHAYSDTNNNKVKLITNGGSFILPILQQWDSLSLNTRTLEVETPEVYTQQGVPVRVNGTVVIKIGSTQDEIATAAEQFLGKSEEQINGEGINIVEGHLRAILGTLTVEDIYKNRDAFASKVLDIASSDLAKMGLQIVSFTIKDIKDPNGYLDALGQKQIAEVKKNADIAKAEAEKETRIQTALAHKEAEQQEIQRSTEIADAKRENEVKLADFNQQQETAKALAQKEIINAQMEAKQLQKEKDIELAEKDAELQDKTLRATVYKQADAERYAAETKAAADKAAAIANAEAEQRMVELAADAKAHQVKVDGESQAEATRAIGEANASRIRAEGVAEADATSKNADALKRMNDAGRLKLILDVLPALFEANAKAYQNVDKITMFAKGDLTGESTTNLAKQLSMINEMTGIDLADMMNNAMAQRAGNKEIVEAVEASDAEPVEAASEAE